jgi:multiple antibiotic resistance protein
MAHNVQVFMMLFLMLGPFKIIPPFLHMTVHADKVMTRQLVTRSILFSIGALLVAAFLGENILTNYGIPVHILAAAGGIILFLVALLNIVSQFHPTHTDPSPEAPTLNMAVFPLAFPTIVTPYGIAAVIVFMTMAHDLNGQLLVGAMVTGIMILNLLVMLIARKIQKPLMIILPLLGAVLGVIQVALGLQIVVNSFKQILEG